MNTISRQLCLVLLQWVVFAPAVLAQVPRTLSVPADPNGYTPILTDLEFSADGKELVAGYGFFVGFLQEPDPGRVILWDVAKRKMLWKADDHKDGISGVAFSVDGNVVTASYGGTAKVRNARTGKNNATISPTGAPITCQSVSPDGRLLALATTQRKNKIRPVTLFTLPSGRKVGGLKGHADDILAIAFSPNGRLIVTAGMDETIRIWDVATRKELHVIETQDVWVESVAWSPNGKVVAVGGRVLSTRAARTKGTGIIRIYDAAKWKIKRELPRHKESVTSLAISPDGKWLVAASGVGKIYQLGKPNRAKMIDGDVFDVAFSPDGRTLAASDSSNIRLLSLKAIIAKSRK